jgi:hypothetical protein
MSLKQIHELDKIVNKRRRTLKRELKILEIKKIVYNKIQTIVEMVIDTYYDIIDRFTYENKTLAFAKRK